MAHHKSALKRIIQNEKRRLSNQRVRSAMRSRIRLVRAAVVAGDKAAAATTLHDAIRDISKAASKGIIPKQRASRNTSRLTKLVNRMG